VIGHAGAGFLEIMHGALDGVMNLVMVSLEAREKAVAAGFVELCRAISSCKTTPFRAPVLNLNFLKWNATNVNNGRNH
jgi:hypothetical protein